jgi:hypothetical protein
MMIVQRNKKGMVIWSGKGRQSYYQCHHTVKVNLTINKNAYLSQYDNVYCRINKLSTDNSSETLTQGL